MSKTNKRKSIPKSVRFEVFKRDKFTCQYCGRSAPEVILELDHIQSVDKGGDNNIMNLVTACRDCNRGKSNKLLDDNSTITIQKKQLDDLQERREQLEMMVEWRKSLENQLNAEVNAVEELIDAMTGHELTDHGKTEMRKHIKRFGAVEVCKACEIAFDKYYKGDDRSWEFAFKKIGGVCYNRKVGRTFESHSDTVEQIKTNIQNMSNDERLALYRQIISE